MKLKMLFGTKEVAKLLGVSISRLARAVWEERVAPPPKGPGGVFLWGAADIERASWVLRHKSADDILDKLNESENPSLCNYGGLVV